MTRSSLSDPFIRPSMVATLMMPPAPAIRRSTPHRTIQPLKYPGYPGFFLKGGIRRNDADNGCHSLYSDWIDSSCRFITASRSGCGIDRAWFSPGSVATRDYGSTAPIAGGRSAGTGFPRKSRPPLFLMVVPRGNVAACAGWQPWSDATPGAGFTGPMSFGVGERDAPVGSPS